MQQDFAASFAFIDEKIINNMNTAILKIINGV
jgi:hypothetical protein